MVYQFKKKFNEQTNYTHLSDSTKEKYASFFKKVHTSGKTFSELKKMNDKDFAFFVGIKLGKRLKGGKGYSNVYSHRKIIRQIEGTKDRRFGSINKTLKKYETFGYRLDGLKKIRKELIKTSGSQFLGLAMEVNDRYPKLAVENSDGTFNYENVYQKTRAILNVSKKLRHTLSKKDQKILLDYGS